MGNKTGGQEEYPMPKGVSEFPNNPQMQQQHQSNQQQQQQPNPNKRPSALQQKQQMLAQQAMAHRQKQQQQQQQKGNEQNIAPHRSLSNELDAEQNMAKVPQNNNNNQIFSNPNNGHYGQNQKQSPPSLNNNAYQPPPANNFHKPQSPHKIKVSFDGSKNQKQQLNTSTNVNSAMYNGQQHSTHLQNNMSGSHSRHGSMQNMNGNNNPPPPSQNQFNQGRNSPSTSFSNSGYHQQHQPVPPQKQFQPQYNAYNNKPQQNGYGNKPPPYQNHQQSNGYKPNNGYNQNKPMQQNGYNQYNNNNLQNIQPRVPNGSYSQNSQQPPTRYPNGSFSQTRQPNGSFSQNGQQRNNQFQQPPMQNNMNQFNGPNNQRQNMRQQPHRQSNLPSPPISNMNRSMSQHKGPIPSLQAATTIQATTKESVYMDMTIAEVEKLQAKQGNLANKIPTQNLDKNKTVRQILAEQKANNNNALAAVLDKANNNNNNNAPLKPQQNNAYNPNQNKWNKPNNSNNYKSNNQFNNAQKPQIRSNYSGNQPPLQQQNQNNFNRKPPQNGPPPKRNNMMQKQPPPHQQQPNGQQFQTRMRGSSVTSSGGYAPRPKPNYNQPRPFNAQSNQQQRPQQNAPFNNNNRQSTNKNNNVNRPFSKQNAFQIQGFQPAAASGLTAKSVGQKMGPQGLTHKEVQRPNQNPWNNQNRQSHGPRGQNGQFPPPPNKYQGQKYNHNFKNKTYNKKQVRQKRAQQQQQKENQNNSSAYPPPGRLDGTQYDSDESVFVHQADLARRHSWGSSSLEPAKKAEPFGKPVYVNNKNKKSSNGDDNNNNNNGPSSNVSFANQNEADKYGSIATKSVEELVSALELTEKAFYKKYWIEDGTVGSGSFAKVRKVTRKKDKQEFALKMIKKAGKSKEDLEALQREIAILAKLKHPNVVALKDWCETKKRIYMVVQFCDGGDVFERILKQKTFSEKEAAHVVRKVAEGLQHVHENNIIHRDLKPDNLMYLTKDPESNIMIIDFGLAGDCTDAPLTTPCGTAHYVAPEVLSSKPYNSKADMWSLGVIIYMLLCGFPPFFDAQGNQKRLYKLIKLGKYRFPSPYWDYVSEQAKDLIKQLLQLDTNKRLSAKQVLKHKWIDKSGDIEEVDLGKMYMEQMEHFSSSRHFVDQGLKLHGPGSPNGGPNSPATNVQIFKNKQHMVDNANW